KDGGRMTLVSDESWRTHPSPNTMLGIWNFMNFGGELYDANKEISDWCDARYDDSAWKQATVYQPKLIVSAELLEPNRKVQEIKPVAIETLDDGSYRIDMGVNYAGFFEMDVKGEPGQRIDFEWSEREEDLMTHRLHSAYIIGPKSKGKFENRFNYGSGRWVHVKGLASKPKLSDAKGYLVRTDYRRVGHFESDDELLNNIYDTVLWTYENLTVGGYVVDCPQRERMGYGGDGHATIDCGLNNYDLAAFYRKWGQDWRDVQKPSGDLPYTSPTYWGGGGPAWSGFCITLPWDNYRRYGDKRILEENYPTMQRWLAFLETHQKNNLMVRWGGEWDFLGDWLWPGAEGVNGDTRETLFFNNAYWVYNLRAAAMIAEILGDAQSAKSYLERSKEVSNAIQKEFYNPEDASYVNGFQAYLAIALKTHIMPEPLREKVWDRLEKEIFEVRKGHIHAGITGGAFLFKTLNQFEKNDWIYEMASKEDYPSWGEELKRGATTIWEDWEGRKGHSL
ncbi:family 78 glycoside hydrolase catalytic domain, partial [bacterium]|nr:family 78 glycoside hydrolase catalytic domain [bacterium]